MTPSESPFPGFLPGGPVVALPVQLLSEVVPAIDDGAELRVTLQLFLLVGRQRGPAPGIRGSVLASDRTLLRRLDAEAIVYGLTLAVARGTVLAELLDDGDTFYLLHTEAARRALERIRAGALAIPAAAGAGRAGQAARAAIPAGSPSRAVEVFEQEIGMLTPAVAEALRDALERYPEAWVVDAIRQAALHNARSWPYAASVLRRWEAEGRDDGVTGEAAQGVSADDPYSRFIRRV